MTDDGTWLALAATGLLAVAGGVRGSRNPAVSAQHRALTEIISAHTAFKSGWALPYGPEQGFDDWAADLAEAALTPRGGTAAQRKALRDIITARDAIAEGASPDWLASQRFDTWAAGLAQHALTSGSRALGSRYRKSTEVFSITSRDGTPYNLRVIPPGGGYGVDDRVINKGFALLEFYWPKPTGFTQPWGQFTGSRYRLTTLVKSADGRPKGLAIDNTRKGQFSAATMNRAIVWALGGNPDAYYG